MPTVSEAGLKETAGGLLGTVKRAVHFGVFGLPNVRSVDLQLVPHVGLHMPWSPAEDAHMDCRNGERYPYQL